MQPELFVDGAVYAISLKGGRHRFVQWVGRLRERPLVVVLDVVREDLPFAEELEDVGPLVVQGQLIYFAIDDHLAAEDALCSIPVRWVAPGERAPSVVRLSELPKRLLRELSRARAVASSDAAATAPERAPRNRQKRRKKGPTLIDDDGVMVVTCLRSVAPASESFRYPDTLLAARAKGELVFFETGDEGRFEVREVEAKTDHQFVGSLATEEAWWIMPLSTFTMGFDAQAKVTNALRLSPSSAPIYAARRRSVIELVFAGEAGAPLGDSVPQLAMHSEATNG